jgi:hypothetical protein
MGVTVIFVAGMFAMIRWRSSVQGLAWLTLLLIAAYMALRGLVPT